MEHEIHNEAGVVILDLRGEIDVSTAPGLRDILMGLIEDNAGPVLVNLSNVLYMDSAGLSVFIAAHHKAQNAGRVLGLVNPQQPIQQVLKLTRVDKVFQIFPSIEEGIGAVSET
jgi:anti-sigma B factor antagonist